MGLVDNDLMMVLSGGKNPVARPPVPRTHARREELAEELRLHRLPAAAERARHRDAWSPTATCPRTSPRPPSARSGSTSRYRLLELTGRERRRLAPGLAAVQGGRVTATSSPPRTSASAVRRPRSPRPPARSGRSPCPGSSGCRCSSSRRCTSCWPSSSAASTRSSARSSRSGTRSCGPPTSRSTCSPTSSARTASSARPCCARRSTCCTASVLCLVIAFPIAYYVARLVGPVEGAAAHAADRAVLDQLHDADAGLGEPARQRRPGQPGPLARRGAARRHRVALGQARPW